ncbi:MAG: acyltransferase [Legionellales bacterium]|nr:acyltransferase [Legionellales bacterium]
MADKQYYPQLNSLRGFAALSVILWHYYLVLNDDPSKIFKPYLFFMYGTGAVILFFVLSGFVLASSYQTNKGYIDYIARRIFRIYPAYYFALLLSIMGFYFLNPAPIKWLAIGFNLWQTGAITLSSIFNSLILINPQYFNFFVTPSWSLTIEMIISIFFPILLNCYKGKFKNFFAIIYILTIIILHKYKISPFSSMIFYYSIYFVLGIMLYVNQSKLSFLAKWYLLPFYVCLYASMFFSPTLANCIHDPNLLTGIGSAGFIILAIHHKKTEIILNYSIFNFLGKISYSCYLLHMPILLITVYLLQKHLTIDKVLFLYIVTLTITILMSYISFRFIEKPFINIGKKMGALGYKMLVYKRAG